MIKKRWVFGALGLLAAVAIALGVSRTALAQDATPTPETTLPERAGNRLHRGAGLDEGGLQAAADALGMTPDALQAELTSGKTLSEVADEQGVALEDVQAAIQAARVAATREAIQQAVDDGSMTQEKADWLLEGLDKGFWGGSGRDALGFGRFGGFGPHSEKGVQAPDIDS